MCTAFAGHDGDLREKRCVRIAKSSKAHFFAASVLIGGLVLLRVFILGLGVQPHGITNELHTLYQELLLLERNLLIQFPQKLFECAANCGGRRLH